MLGRVRDFGNTYKAQFAEGSEGSKAFTAITESVAALDKLTGSKMTAPRVSKKERLAAKRALLARIAAISGAARVLGKAVPGAEAKFPPPPKQNDVSVLQTGRLFVQEAGAVKEGFIRCGLPPTFLDELTKAVDSFEQTIRELSATRVGAVVAQQSLRDTIRNSVDTVRSLDVLVAIVLGSDPQAMREWKRMRRVEAVARHGVPTVSQETPQAPDVAAPPAPASAPSPTTTGVAPAGVVEEQLPRAS